MDRLTAARIQTVRDHMRLECESDWDGVIATFAHPRYELTAAGLRAGKGAISCRTHRLCRALSTNGGHTEFIIRRAFARPVGVAHPTNAQQYA